MCLCPDKCSIFFFYHSRSPHSFDYKLLNVSLPRATFIRDLGVTLDCQLNFKQQWEEVITEANKTLGCILRVSSEF